jgi:Mrp family chromosome partitioning ATPase
VSTSTNLLRQIERTLRVPIKAATELIDFSESSPADLYEPLVRKFIQIRHSERDGAIFAFSSVAPGEGVSYVTAKVACELSQHSGENVLLTTAASLKGLVPAQFAGTPFADRKAKVWRVGNAFPDAELKLLQVRGENFQFLRKRFAYVLIDCPALIQSTTVVPMGRFTDGVILVVAAGETRREHIEQAQALLEASSAKLLGMVLNKRTNPVPKFVAKYF